MKLITHFTLLLLALTASVYGQLNVNLPGGNGVTFSGTKDAAPTAKPGLSGFEELETATTFDLFVTTPDDILIIDFTLNVTAGSVYQDSTTQWGYGPRLIYDTRPPYSPAVPSNPHFAADSWISTPGSGSSCAQINGRCPGFENVGQVSHFDSSFEDSQTDFNFARITLLPDETGNAAAEFSGFIHVANQPRPLLEPFSFTLQSTVPEPSSLGLLMPVLLGGLAIVRRPRSRRR